MLVNLLIFICVAGGVWLLSELILGGASSRKQMQKNIQRIQQRKVQSSRNLMQEMSLRRKTTELQGLLYWLTKPLPDFKRLGNRLERAGKQITPKQYALRCLLAALVITMGVSGLFHKPLLLGIFLGIIAGVWLPLKLLQRTIEKQNRAFLQLFPDAIDLIVRGLRSGLPVSESLILVSHEVPNPVGAIFATIHNTMKLGVPMEKALLETAKKLELREFNFFTTSIILQRETGGNLSEILNNLSEVLRNRHIMQMKIKAMSSEARASTKIIGALPPLVIAIVGFMSPEYMKPLIYDPKGNLWAGVAVGMMFTGVWIMNRMAKFEI